MLGLGHVALVSEDPRTQQRTLLVVLPQSGHVERRRAIVVARYLGTGVPRRRMALPILASWVVYFINESTYTAHLKSHRTLAPPKFWARAKRKNQGGWLGGSGGKQPPQKNNPLVVSVFKLRKTDGGSTPNTYTPVDQYLVRTSQRIMNRMILRSLSCLCVFLMSL